MFLLVIISYSIVMFFETIPLLRQKNSGKILFYYAMTIFTMIVGVLLVLGVQLPSPSNQIKDIVVAIFGKSN